MRIFNITVEPTGPNTGTAVVSAPATASGGTPVFSTFAGTVEVVDILVKVGDSVTKGQAVAAIEAMKAKHEIKSSVDGKVTKIGVAIGDEIDNTQPILFLA